jgi:vacuolar-type H+-ATPase subunit E/Vma4
MASRDGKIVFENTLDARLELVFRKKLPEVYYVALFSFAFSCLK